MKKLVLIAAILMVLGFVTLSQAATFELRQYFGSLSLPLQAQSTNNLWTFHTTDHNGSFLPPHLYDRSYYDYTVSGSIVGGLVVDGDPGWGDVGPNSIPTFDGLALTTGYYITTPTAVVFRAPQAMSISEIRLLTEMLSWGVTEDGITVTVNSVISGVTNRVGYFTVSGFPMVQTSYTNTAINLQKGDMIEILYGNNGDMSHDHVNANVFIVATKTRK
jgi:hypothetical protein